VLAWLGDGQRWSAAALARASGRKLRTVQRELQALAGRGVVGSAGRARAQRWFATTRIASPMLLLGLYGAR
jgi:predicted transcriptional regulator